MKVDLNRFVGTALAIGVALSFVIIVWGAVLYLVWPPAPPEPLTVSGVLGGAADLNAAATVNLGLFVLLITPVARVLAALVAFAVERDKKYVLISLVVLAVLMFSALHQR